MLISLYEDHDFHALENVFEFIKILQELDKHGVSLDLKFEADEMCILEENEMLFQNVLESIFEDADMEYVIISSEEYEDSHEEYPSIAEHIAICTGDPEFYQHGWDSTMMAINFTSPKIIRFIELCNENNVDPLNTILAGYMLKICSCSMYENYSCYGCAIGTLEYPDVGLAFLSNYALSFISVEKIDALFNLRDYLNDIVKGKKKLEEEV